MSSEFRRVWAPDHFLSWLQGHGSVLSDEFPMIPARCPWVGPPGPDFARAAEAVLGDVGLLEAHRAPGPGHPPDLALAAAAAAHLAAAYSSLPLDLPDPPRQGRKKVRPASHDIYESALDGVLSEFYYRALYDTSFALRVRLKGVEYDRPFIPGHVWGLKEADGPRHCPVMIVGKMPGREEIRRSLNFCGETSQVLYEGLQEAGFAYPSDGRMFYTTNILRFENPDPASDQIASDLLKDCAPLLRIETALVRPEVILVLGAEAVKALLGRHADLKSTVGRVIDFRYDVSTAQRAYRLPYKEEVAAHEPVWMDCKLVTCVHPARVSREPEQRPEMMKSLHLLRRVVDGTVTVGVDPEADRDHRLISTPDQLFDWAEEVLASGATEFALDTEFHGLWPTDPDAHLRTVQVSWAWKKAVCIEVTAVNNAGPVVPRQAVVDALTVLLDRPGVRIALHYAAADLPWLDHLGLGFLAAKFRPPVDDPISPDGEIPPDWRSGPEKTRTEGGFDTILAAHAYEETAELGLKEQAVAHTTAGRYDSPLDDWLTRYCADGVLNGTGKRLKKADLNGFGMIPIDVLWPYASYDADVTYRLFKIYNDGADGRPALLDRDRFGNDCRIPFWVSMRAAPAFLEMRETGILIDKTEAGRYRTTYESVAARKLAEFRAEYHWPPFNPQSVYDCRAFLFGLDYVGKRDREGNPNYELPKNYLTDAAGQEVRVPVQRANPQTGQPEVALLPTTEGAPQPACLRLLPYKNTAKRPKLWTEIRRRNQEHLNAPSCDKESLTVLGIQHPGAWRLRDIKYLQTVGKMVLRPPNRDDQGNNLDAAGQVTEDFDEMEYGSGLMSYLCADGRIRTNFSQTKETRRASSWQPPLQNLGKRREKDYKRLLGAEYPGPLRGIIVAPPGFVLFEADYKGAELAGMAGQAQDRAMMEHCRRMQLPDEGFDHLGNKVRGGKYPHPDHYCIHSGVGIRAFRLRVDTAADVPPYSAEDLEFLARQAVQPGQVHPSKWGLKKLAAQKPQYGSIRDCAKPVVFGYAYGMGAAAAQRKAKEEGADVSLEDAQALIDGLEAEYPSLPAYFAEARRCCSELGYLVGPLGGLRRFYRTTDEKVQGDQEREAQNFPIQNLVADTVSQAMGMLSDHPARGDLGYRMCLQLHDAILFAVPIPKLSAFARFLPTVMESVLIPVRSLTGVYADAPPFSLKIDMNVYTKWGCDVTPEEYATLGIDPDWRPSA